MPRLSALSFAARVNVSRMSHDLESTSETPTPFLMKLASTTLALFALTSITTLTAGTAITSAPSGKLEQLVQPEEQSIYDKIWGLAQIYKNNENPIIEEFDLIGRFQVDYFNVNSSKGNNDFLEIRRFRIGADAFFLNRLLELKAELDTNLRIIQCPDEVFYNRFTNLYAMLNFSEAIQPPRRQVRTSLRIRPQFSDNTQKIFERSFYDDQLIGRQRLHGRALKSPANSATGAITPQSTRAT